MRRRKRLGMLAALGVLAVAAGAFVLWPRPPSRITRENAEQGVSQMTADRAAAFAVAEVKKREGWSGEASPPVRDGDCWGVIVWALPKTPGGFLGLKIGPDGSVLEYERGK
jgi:hypothetical protein